MLYIKTPILNSKIFYPFSVKIMLKIHQKPFGGRAPAGPVGGAAAVWGGEWTEEGRGPQPDFLAPPLRVIGASNSLS